MIFRQLLRLAPWLLAAFVLVGAVWHYNASADVVGITAGHWSKHLVSENITNEEHAWVSLRYNWFTIGRFDNSYKQPGFSGESYHVGVVHDLKLASNVNRWNGDVVLKASVGMMYGYTTFAGHDWSDKDWHGYAAGGPFYQQAFGRSDLEWEAGFMFLADAALPSLGLLYRF